MPFNFHPFSKPSGKKKIVLPQEDCTYKANEAKVKTIKKKLILNIIVSLKFLQDENEQNLYL